MKHFKEGDQFAAAVASEDDVVALRRLIDYAVDEAVRNGLFTCARLLRSARDQLDGREVDAEDICSRFLEGRTPLTS